MGDNTGAQAMTKLTKDQVERLCASLADLVDLIPDGADKIERRMLINDLRDLPPPLKQWRSSDDPRRRPIPDG
jgi:hypothetical protein